MVTHEERYLRKAKESLAGANSEFANQRYNNCANRAYYGCFQAAVAALIRAGVRPGRDGDWPHSVVQAQFVSQFINRRKRLSPEFRNTPSRLVEMRQKADYDVDEVTEIQAARILRQATSFIHAVEEELST